jgi:hypothetical protein
VSALPPGYRLPPIGEHKISQAERERKAGDMVRREATQAVIECFASPEWHRRIVENRPDVVELFVSGRMPGVDYRVPHVQLALKVARVGPV